MKSCCHLEAHCLCQSKQKPAGCQGSATAHWPEPRTLLAQTAGKSRRPKVHTSRQIASCYFATTCNRSEPKASVKKMSMPGERGRNLDARAGIATALREDRFCSISRMPHEFRCDRLAWHVVCKITAEANIWIPLQRLRPAVYRRVWIPSTCSPIIWPIRRPADSKPTASSTARTLRPRL